MRLLAMVGRAQRLALVAGQVAVHLREALLRVLVVAEHRVVPGQLEEIGDAAQLRLGVANELLVLDLDVVVELVAVGARALDLANPALGDGLHGRRVLEDPLEPGERGVAPVADHVDEARLGDPALDLLHPLDVVRRLVAPARLALALCVELEEGADRRLRVDRVERAVAPQQLARVEVEVTPLAVPGDHAVGLLAGDALLPGGLDQRGDEVGLGRDREVRMGVEHQPQQRRPGAGDADDERDGRSRRLARAAERSRDLHDAGPGSSSKLRGAVPSPSPTA